MGVSYHTLLIQNIFFIFCEKGLTNNALRGIIYLGGEGMLDDIIKALTIVWLTVQIADKLKPKKRKSKRRK